MTPSQETLLVTLARLFRTFMINSEIRDGRDPKDSAELQLLHSALEPFDKRDFENTAARPYGKITFEMLGNPDYQFKPEGETEVP